MPFLDFCWPNIWADNTLSANWKFTLNYFNETSNSRLCFSSKYLNTLLFLGTQTAFFGEAGKIFDLSRFYLIWDIPFFSIFHDLVCTVGGHKIFFMENTSYICGGGHFLLGGHFFILFFSRGVKKNTGLFAWFYTAFLMLFYTNKYVSEYWDFFTVKHVRYVWKKQELAGVPILAHSLKLIQPKPDLKPKALK